MNIVGIQIFAVLFAMTMIFFAYVTYKKRDFNALDLIMWFSAWIVFIIITVFPRSVDVLVQKLTLADTMQFLIICGMTFVTALIFYLYKIVRHLQRKLEELVIELAKKNKFEHKK